MENVSECRFWFSWQRGKTGRRFCRSSFLCVCAAAGGAGHRHSMLCVTAQKLPWWMSPVFLLHGDPWSPGIWKLVKTNIFSQSVPILCKHTGVWALFVPLASAATLSSPVGGREFVSRFLLFVLNMLLLIILDYSFCMTRNRDYLFPFLHLCHVLPPISCVSHLNL